MNLLLAETVSDGGRIVLFPTSAATHGPMQRAVPTK